MLAGDFDNMFGPMGYGIFAVGIANLTAIALCLNYDLIRHGLFGFNAFLVGLGVSIFLETGVDKQDWTPDYPVVFGKMCTLSLSLSLSHTHTKNISLSYNHTHTHHHHHQQQKV